MKASQKVADIKNDGVEPEILATAIVSVADAAKKLLSSNLTEEAILVLLKHSTGIPMVQIRQVLHAAVDLRKYVKH